MICLLSGSVQVHGAHKGLSCHGAAEATADGVRGTQSLARAGAAGGLLEGLTPRWPGLLGCDPPRGPVLPGSRATWAASHSVHSCARGHPRTHLFSAPSVIYYLQHVFRGQGGYLIRFTQRKQGTPGWFLLVGRTPGAGVEELALREECPRSVRGGGGGGR